MKNNLNSVEFQELVLKRISRYDDKDISELFETNRDDFLVNEHLDAFIVKAAMLIESKINVGNAYVRYPVAETLIRQYSNKERLQSRMTIYSLLK